MTRSRSALGTVSANPTEAKERKAGSQQGRIQEAHRDTAAVLGERRQEMEAGLEPAGWQMALVEAGRQDHNPSIRACF